MPSSLPQSCKVCGLQAPWEITPHRSVIFECPRCGRYRVTEIVHHTLSRNPLQGNQIVNTSGWIRDNQRDDSIVDLDETTLRHLSALSPMGLDEKTERLFRCISHKFNNIGKTFAISEISLHEFLAFCRALDYAEFQFIFHRCLVLENKWIDNTSNARFAISAKGWIHLENKPSTDSKTCFVAMWFDPATDELYEHGIAPAVYAAGWKPEPVILRVHNNDITDEIIVAIRQSRFMVADFTGVRGGVYYEAGYAQGFGLPVVWTCREDEIPKLHFDTNHMKHISWKNGVENLKTFAKTLQMHIEADSRIGKGAYNRPENNL